MRVRAARHQRHSALLRLLWGTAADAPARTSERPVPRLAVSLPRRPPQAKILCVGMNYADHCKELGKPTPEEPIFFK